MNKKELSASVAKKCGLTAKETLYVLDSFLDEITNSLVEGGPVRLAGFGKFSVKYTQKRPAINPKTMEKVIASASCSPKFRAGKNLKAALEESVETDSSSR